MDSIQWLEAWYQARCNGEWEHHHGVSIQTLDNPGWLVTIDLAGTSLQNTAMEDVGNASQINHAGLEGNHNWLHCRIQDNRYLGAGGPSSLLAICEVFRKWVESQTAP
jgi:hypothetical protein